MVKSARRTGLIFGLVLLGAFAARAVDFTTWRVGDVATETITTPVAMDVIDSEATAARQAEAALSTAAIFRGYTSVSNTMLVKVTAAFAEVRSNFLAGLKE